MALIGCGECGKEISSEAPACPHCGAPNRAYVKPMGLFSKLLIGAFVLTFLFLGFGCLLASSPDGQARSKERDAIEYCESEYERLRENPGTTRGALEIAYGACEMMKREFREKWNREP